MKHDVIATLTMPSEGGVAVTTYLLTVTDDVTDRDIEKACIAMGREHGLLPRHARRRGAVVEHRRACPVADAELYARYELARGATVH